jgi:glycosyltransferase involved in cell wall biosynthesis
MGIARPEISVVIASLVGEPFINACLASLESQATERGDEVIVVACGDTSYAERLERLYRWVRVVHQPERETVPKLRLRGAELARGNIVAIIEEHCLAAPDWLDTIAAAHADGKYGVVGGPVVDHANKRLCDWVVYFCEYNGYLPPWVDGDTTNLGSANIAYRRDVLLKYRPLLESGYWEAGLHPQLIADSIRFHSLGGMVVRHCGPFPYRYYLGQRYWFSRAFAGCRARRLTTLHRVAYLLGAPLVPCLLLGRMAQRVFKQRCRIDKFAQVLPLLIPVLLVYVAGEFVGYLAGPGDALLKVE